ncbi:lytic transglycosylase domain-containing protein [Arvimicrobium flavum]|uniref:lytic transglycosylase domain-containing protein n=1 Tax=Arvimicrobium flavum TaxID=3393320 RepID=UPI00237A181A|nr:transglycosylase SLT domain-containing protein [Mesorhizobium shangrilense]
MKKLCVLTAALAAGLMSFAANAQDRVTDASKAGAKVVSDKVDLAAASKPSKPNAVIGEKCPYLLGCGDTTAGKSADKAASKAIDKTKTASIGKKAANTTRSSASGRPFASIVAKYAATYGVPADLAHAVIHVESSGRPNARGSAGEIGLMQIKPATARMMGYSGSASGLFHPETNIKFGMKYLSKAHELGGGTTCGTILKYNAGHAAKRMNKISSAYCAKVQRLLGSI